MKDGLYSAPQKDMKFVLQTVLNIEEMLAQFAPAVAVDQETLEQIIEGADQSFSLSKLQSVTFMPEWILTRRL